MTALTPEEKAARALLLTRLAEARARMEAAFQTHNADVQAAHVRLRSEAQRYNALLTQTAEFMEGVADARIEWEGPRPYEQQRVRDMADGWYAGASEVEHVDVLLDEPRLYTFVADGESDPVDVLRDLPTEV